YGRVVTYDFINFDDNLYVTANQNVQSGITSKSIIWAFSFNEVAYWHPLPLISHMIDCRLFGLNPGKHHLVNLIFHILNSILLFIILKQATGALWRSAIVALLFAIHPINVESVAWIAERKNVLSTFFWMLTMVAYVFYTKRPAVYRYLMVMFFFVLGLLSKPMLVTLPFVLLLFDYWPLERITLGSEKGVVSKIILEKVPLIILSLISVFISSFSLKYARLFVSQESVPFDLRIANAFVSYLKYIAKTVWPQNLAIYYPFPSVIPLWHIIGSVIFILAVSAFALSAAKKKGYIFTGWFWYAGTLLPVIGIVQGGLWPAMADRWAYIPVAGFLIMLIWGLHELFVERFKIRKLLLYSTGMACLSIMVSVAYLQVGYWKNSYTLYKHALEVTGGSDLVHNNMGSYLLRQGSYLLKQGRLNEAKHHFSEALVINPRYEEALNNIGIIFYSEGKYHEAIDYYLKALKVNPEFTDAHNNLGVAMISIGKTDDAIYHFKKALIINPEYGGAFENLKKALKLKTGSDKNENNMKKAE
ncbi:MAG: tetratricopeptide repeat protein, partial [Desulfobacterales bacterium]|nr:tetratricopeptide repeat protein [Desulfobacterales bacterium]